VAGFQVTPDSLPGMTTKDDIAALTPKNCTMARTAANSAT